MNLDQRLAETLLKKAEFTADDITNNGELTIDPEHKPNGKQSAIGAKFREWQSRGLIYHTSRTTRSKSRHRHSGMIGIWARTGRGLEWAQGIYDDATCT